MPVSIAELIDRLGGPDAAASLTGVTTEAVRKWRSADAIPSRHWPAIMAATGLAMEELSRPAEGEVPAGATAALVLADGSVFWGRGFGANGISQPAELCFSTGMTGYQETLTDPSFAGQIITFTFPHIGNVGANEEDIEATTIFARGLVVKEDTTEPSNYRATTNLDTWLKRQNTPGIAGLDTRALTLRIRDLGAPNAVLAFPADGKFDLAALARRRRRLAGTGRAGPGRRSVLHAKLRLGRGPVGLGHRLRQADRAEAQGRGGRLRRQAQHPAQPGRCRL